MKAALLALSILLLAVPMAEASGGNVCDDREKSVDGVAGTEGNLCNDGALWVCAPQADGTTKCVRYDWCNFCPGPVIW